MVDFWWFVLSLCLIIKYGIMLFRKSSTTETHYGFTEKNWSVHIRKLSGKILKIFLKKSVQWYIYFLKVQFICMMKSPCQSFFPLMDPYQLSSILFFQECCPLQLLVIPVLEKWSTCTCYMYFDWYFWMFKEVINVFAMIGDIPKYLFKRRISSFPHILFVKVLKIFLHK